ncbi:MAG: Lrp/AsnC family transcriptional regulator [Candidatus Methanospirareceae archaeon]
MKEEIEEEGKEKEEEILRILEENARVSDGEIARMVGIEEERVKAIIAELESKKIIRRYKAVIDYEKAGIEIVKALIDVKVSPERDTGYDSIAERIARFPEVESVRLVSGEYDLSVLVSGKTMHDVAYFVAAKIAPLEQVRSAVTHFILKTYKENGELYEEEGRGKRLAVTL